MPRNANKRSTSKWTAAEDSALRRLVQKHGEKAWAQIARELPNRLGKQCRERWRNQLDPSIVRTPFTPEEDELVIEMVKSNGTTWARIAEAIPGRTENMIKNRYYANLIKRMGDNESKKRPSSHKASVSRPSTTRRGRNRHLSESESDSESVSLSSHSEEDQEEQPVHNKFSEPEEDDDSAMEDIEEDAVEEDASHQISEDEDDDTPNPTPPATPLQSQEPLQVHHVLDTPMGEPVSDSLECNLHLIDHPCKPRPRATVFFEDWLVPSSTDAPVAPSMFLDTFTPTLQSFDAPLSLAQKHWQAQLTSDMNRAIARLKQQWHQALATDAALCTNVANSGRIVLPPFHAVVPPLPTLGDSEAQPDLLSAQTLCDIHHNAEEQTAQATKHLAAPRAQEWDGFLDQSLIAQ